MKFKFGNLLAFVSVLVGLGVFIHMRHQIFESLRMVFAYGPQYSQSDKLIGLIAIAIICFTVALAVRLVLFERRK